MQRWSDTQGHAWRLRVRAGEWLLPVTTLLFVLAALAGLLPGTAVAQGFSLGVRVDFPTGVDPTSVAIGDLNGDGKPDLAVANYGANTVSVLLGNGAGLRGEDRLRDRAQSRLGGDRGPERGREARPGGGELQLQHGVGAARQRHGRFGPKTDFATGNGLRARSRSGT